MKTYILIHKHKHGDSLFPFQSEKEFFGWHEEENTNVREEFGDVLDALGVGYESDKGEWIEFIEIDLANLITIWKQDTQC